MLPIVKHKPTRIVSHRVAVLAAAVCLVLAFVSEQTGLAERVESGHAATAQSADDERDGGRVSGGRQEPDGNGEAIELMPWFHGLGRGR